MIKDLLLQVSVCGLCQQTARVRETLARQGAELAKKGVYTDVNDRILQVKCNDGNSTLQNFCRVLCL